TLYAYGGGNSGDTAVVNGNNSGDFFNVSEGYAGLGNLGDNNLNLFWNGIPAGLTLNGGTGSDETDFSATFATPITSNLGAGNDLYYYYGTGKKETVDVGTNTIQRVGDALLTDNGGDNW